MMQAMRDRSRLGRLTDAQAVFSWGPLTLATTICQFGQGLGSKSSPIQCTAACRVALLVFSASKQAAPPFS